jgi:vancomycin resistance protein YoaR
MKKVRKLFLSLVIVSCLLVIIWGGAKLFYFDKFYPGSTVAGVNVSGLTAKQAKTELAKQIKNFKNKTIWLEYKNKSFAYEVDFSKVDFKIEKSVEKAIANNNLSSLLSNDRSIIVKADSQLKEELTNYLTPHVNQEISEETIIFEDNNIRYQEPKPEVKLIDDKTWNNFIDSISNLDQTVAVAYQEKYPRTSDNLLSTYHKLSQLINLTPIEVYDQENDRVITEIKQADIANWVVIDNEDKKRCRIEEGCLLLAKMESISAQTSFDEQKLDNWIGGVVGEVNQTPTDAKLLFKDSKLKIVEPAQFGYEIDPEILAQKITEILDNPTKRIALNAKIKKPTVREDNLEELGIEELVGKGVTTFYGSSSNRIHNIKVGSSRISGVLIEPGETFSAAERVGEVEKSTGYLPEYVIKGKETVKEYGGGLCQVSSTLFRAALDSGFDIVERRPHGYRVSYYEPPIGMDAAIYVPWTDLKFTNNTDNWVLIQYQMEGYQLTFNVYGTDDGREVKISEPQSGNFKSPPKPIEIVDKTLKPGERIVEEKARQGADAWFDYKVKKDGEYIINETITSHYQAWPAKIRVGPEKDKPKKDEQETEEDQEDEDKKEE